MEREYLLYPVAAMAVLTAIVWTAMYVTRVREVRAKRIRVQDLASRAGAGQALGNVAGPSENLMNLFELPVLFYVLMTLLYVTGRGGWIYLALAWAYVILRAIHSFIHCTYNRVWHRFTVYLAGSAVLWAMWAGLIWELLGGT